jgi:hypothetical protein
VPKILLKRGAKGNLPTLEEGEPGYTTDTKEVFIGTSDLNVQLAKQADVSSLTEGLSQTNTRFDDLKLVDANAEVLDARGGEATLGGRFDKAETALADNEKLIKTVFYVTAKEYGALGDGIQDFSPILQKALNDAAAVGGVVVIPAGANRNYLFKSTVNQPMPGTVKVLIQSTQSSYYGLNTGDSMPVIFTRPLGSTFDFFTCEGRGFELVGATFWGNGDTGKALNVKRGFEFKMSNCRFYNFNGTAFSGIALQNAQWNRLFFDFCGSPTEPAVYLGGNDQYGRTNTLYVNDVHIERSKGTEIQLGSLDSTATNDCVEFSYFNQFHIERTDNTGGTMYDGDMVSIGNARGIELELFTFGAYGKHIHVKSPNAYGITLLPGSFLYGDMSAGTPTPPPRLIHLEQGDGFNACGIHMDAATTEYILIESSFGSRVSLFGNSYFHKNDSANDINDQRVIASATNGTTFPNMTNKGMVLGDGTQRTLLRLAIERAWDFGQWRGTGAAAELSLRPASNGKTFNIDSQDLSQRVFTALVDNTAPGIGFLGASAKTKQTVTGSRGGNTALASLITALANYGLITDNTTT